MWYESREEKCEQYVDVWDCGDDLARLKCRKCQNQYLVGAPVCNPCHIRETVSNRVSIRTEILFTFLMSGLKEAMGKAKRAKVLTPITLQPFTREMFGALRHEMTQRNKLQKQLPLITYSRKSVKGVSQHFWHLVLDEAWHLSRTMHSVTKDPSWPRLTGTGVARIIDNHTAVVLLIPCTIKLKTSDANGEERGTLSLLGDVVTLSAQGGWEFPTPNWDHQPALKCYAALQILKIESARRFHNITAPGQALAPATVPLLPPVQVAACLSAIPPAMRPTLE